MTVDGQPGLEDIDGFYAVSSQQEIGTTDSHQRRQALVFRDTVRQLMTNVEAYAKFPEQLVLAMGTAESGNYDNAQINGAGDYDGIMQVSCVSGKKGATQANQETVTCDELPPDYEATAQSIKYSASDGLLFLNEKFGTAKEQDTEFPDPDCYEIYNQQGQIDFLMTAIVYYNAECTYPVLYANGQGQPKYLDKVARQLDPKPEDISKLPENMAVTDFLADADYLADPELIQSLDFGQTVVDQQVADQQ